MINLKVLLLAFILIFSLMGCVLPQPVPISESSITTAEPAISITSPANTSIESTQLSKNQTLSLWISPYFPEYFYKETHLFKGLPIVEEKGDSELAIELTQAGESSDFSYYYALAATFTTLTDNISTKDFTDMWRGEKHNVLNNSSLYISPETLTRLEAVLGECKYSELRITKDISCDRLDWKKPDVFAIVPFEALTPNLKVLRIDNVSILDNAFRDKSYPLVLTFSFLTDSETPYPKQDLTPMTNRKSSEITRLLMTGVTALVRRLGVLMETKGMTYPAREIFPWIQSADLVHLSNEVAFAETCPAANWNQKNLQFCSKPEYSELLDYLDPDVIELSGNHLIDWDVPAFEETLVMYENRGWPVYAGGSNLFAAQKPLVIEHNNNRLAFIGCNIAGPDFVWAQADRAGAAPCDFDNMEKQLVELRSEGYLPIVTLQYYEYYDTKPSPNQERDFDRLAAAGAVIVQGSQSHVPQTMKLTKETFIHYGLGNFLFDQMRNPDGLGHSIDLGTGETIPAVRLELLDLHTFYQGRLINTELLTAILEESGKPRPMTEGEREMLLQYLFEKTR